MEGKPQPNQDLETGLIEMIKGVDPPEMCEVDEHCIYKLPPNIREVHPEAYTPKIISIGPFHNPRGPNATRDNNNILWSMEDLKPKYLRGFLNRTDLSVEAFVPKLRVLENRIRNCYAGGAVIYESNDFLKIIITDACFIIELFLRHYYEDWTQKDPILSKFRLANDIRMELLLLENQLPFFVLEEIFIFAGLNRIFAPFVQITIDYFKQFKEEFKKEQDINIERVSPKHFVDLLRIFSMPSSSPPQSSSSSKKSKEKIHHVYSVSQLSEAGLVFEVSKDRRKCLLDLEFDDKKGVLKMPYLTVDDDTEIILKNILAFGDCHYTGSGYLGQYIRLLDFLINTEKDVSILVEKGIIINYMSDISSVATMINSLSTNLHTGDLNGTRYHSLCLSLNGFYENPRNKHKAVFMQEYFNTPWKKASTIAAALLLFLTIVQTICSVWSLIKQQDVNVS